MPSWASRFRSGAADAWLLKAVLLLGSGCVDTDRDGLRNSTERRLGTDPAAPDSDGDRALDGREVELGTDPLAYDSDGDSYADGDELVEGTDPLDAESRIYAGGWPYYWDKDSITDPGTDHPLLPRSGVPRLLATDQFGEQVDLYDFAFSGRPILLEACSIYIDEPCTTIAEWRNRVEGSPRNLWGWNPVRRAHDDGRVHWITLLAEGEQDDVVPTLEQGRAWGERFPDVPVLVLPDRDFYLWMRQEWSGDPYPMTAWLDEDMTIERIDRETDPIPQYSVYRLAAWFEDQEEEQAQE